MTSQPDFNPNNHMTDLKGRAYLGARQRVRWLRSEHPDWAINTGIVELDFGNGYAVVYAEILDANGRLIARGMKQEERKDFGDFVEKAETGAVARACALAGYGTEDAVDLDEGTVSDTPVAPSSGTGRVSPPARPAAAPRTTTTDIPDDLPEFPPNEWDTAPVSGNGWTFKQLAEAAETKGIPKNTIYSTADKLFGKGTKVTDLDGGQREQIAFEMGLVA